MVHFFGIFQPGTSKAHPGSEAPHKSGFFGDLAPPPHADPLAPDERAVLAAGDGLEDIEEDHHLIRVATPAFF